MGETREDVPDRRNDTSKGAEAGTSVPSSGNKEFTGATEGQGWGARWGQVKRAWSARQRAYSAGKGKRFWKD